MSLVRGVFKTRRQHPVPGVLLTVLLGILLTALPARAQGRRRGGGEEAPPMPPWMGKAELSGAVVDETGKGVADAKVTLVCVAENAGFSVKTRKNGQFVAKDLKAGEWRVQVEAPNFPTWRQTVQVAEQNTPAMSVQLKHDNSPELLANAESLFKAGKFEEARAEYMKVLEGHPNLTGINRAVAFTYGRQGNHPEALKYLDLALAGDPNDSMLLQLAAASAMQLSDYPRTMDYLAKIDDATMTDPEILVNASVNLLNKRRSADAIKVLDRVIARFPQASDPYYYRGVARLQTDAPADARADLEKYISLAPPEAPQMSQAKELLSKLK